MKERITKYLDKFVFPGDKLKPDDYRKGRFFVVSTLFFLLLALSGFVFMISLMQQSSYSVTAAVLNFVLFPLAILIFVVYRRYGLRVPLVNFLTTLGFITNIGAYETTGGIYSPDNLWGILISAWVFLVADKKSGIFWFLMTSALFVFFYYASINGWKDFRNDTAQFDEVYFLVNYLLGSFFLCMIILLHESGKDKYLKELVAAKAEIEQQKKIVEQRNKDVTDSIRYAEKIQRSRITNEVYIERALKRLNRS